MHQDQYQEAADLNTLPERLRLLVKESTELARIVAKNPNADWELLRELAVSDDEIIRLGVIQNPNTPIDVLLSLAQEFPKEFILNPVFPFLLLENPDLAREISLSALLKLLECEELPGLFLSGAAEHQNAEVLQWVAKHPNTPEIALEVIAAKTRFDYRLGQILAERQGVSLRVLEKLAIHGAVGVRLYLAKRSQTPSSVLEKLIEYPEHNWNFRLEIEVAVAKNPNTPLEILNKLIDEGHFKVKQAVAKRANLQKELIVHLATDYRVQAAKLLCENLHIPATLLEELAEHSHLRVRQLVAAHPNTPLDLLIEAAKIHELRLHVAENPSTPNNLLEELALDSREDVQAAVANNPSTSAFILGKLAENPARDLAVAMHKNTPLELLPKILERLAADTRLSVRIFVAKHPQTPAEILAKWAKDKWEVRLYIAQNPNAPVEVLEQLAKDFSSEVRASVGKNTNTPASALERLANDWEAEVRRAVASNTSTPTDVLERLIKDYQCTILVAENPSTPQNALRQLEGLPGFEWYLVRHANTPLDVRQKLLANFSRSYIELDRLYVARHPDTPTEILEILAKDKDVKVQRAAKRALRKRK